MAQLFGKAADDFFKMFLLALLLVPTLLVALGYGWSYSSFNTGEDMAVEQPVPFSHEHHVGGLGIDCRYCHTTVETSRFAGMPASSICMNCHSHIWKDSPMLEPVRASYQGIKPLVWARVNDLPDFVYFDHSVHVVKGVGCETCHGRVDRMPLLAKAHSFSMEWCLACHRNPEPFIRPRDAVTVMGWDAAPHAEDARPDVTSRMDCVTCHR